MNNQKSEPAEDKPVAWTYEAARCFDMSTGVYSDWDSCLSVTRPTCPEGSIRNLKALNYATQQQCQRCADLEADRDTWQQRTEFSFRERDKLQTKVAELTQELNQRRAVMTDIVRTLGFGMCGLQNQEVSEKVKQQAEELTAIKEYQEGKKS